MVERFPCGDYEIGGGVRDLLSPAPCIATEYSYVQAAALLRRANSREYATIR